MCLKCHSGSKYETTNLLHTITVCNKYALLSGCHEESYHLRCRLESSSNSLVTSVQSSSLVYMSRIRSIGEADESSTATRLSNLSIQVQYQFYRQAYIREAWRLRSSEGFHIVQHGKIWCPAAASTRWTEAYIDPVCCLFVHKGHWSGYANGSFWWWLTSVTAL